MVAHLKSIVRILLRPMVAAGIIGTLIALWLVTGELDAQRPGPPTPLVAAEVASGPLVETRWSRAEPVREHLLLRGQLEPLRVVKLRAETEGRVVEVPARKGERVSGGGVILRLALNDRAALRAEAEALVEQRRQEATTSTRLLANGVLPEAVASERRAELAAAEAQLQTIQVQIEHTTLRAPFPAILNERPVELGDFVDRGDVVAVLVDDSKLLVTAQVSQRHVSAIVLGQLTRARLVSGQELVGEVSYVSRVGEIATRSFRVEILVDNANGGLVTGTSVEVVMPLGETNGHFVPSAALTTTSDGDLAITVVDAQERVAVSPVQLIRAENDGVWVSGLRDELAIVVAGQGFAVPGQTLAGVATREMPSSVVRLAPRQERGGSDDAQVH